MSSFAEGVLAGFGIAIPVGAIGVLLVDLAMRRGFKPAAAAGAGVATADFVYAGVAVLLGAAVADAVESFQETLRIVSAIVLFGRRRGRRRRLRRAAHRFGMTSTPTSRPSASWAITSPSRFAGTKAT